MLAVAPPVTDICTDRTEVHKGVDQENNIFQYHDYERQLDSGIKEVLSSVKQLLWKYKMYNKSSETPAVSGGLQQYILNKLRKKGDSEKSLTQRLKALYLKDESVTLDYSAETATECSAFDQLPVSQVFLSKS